MGRWGEVVEGFGGCVPKTKNKYKILKFETNRAISLEPRKRAQHTVLAISN